MIGTAVQNAVLKAPVIVVISRNDLVLLADLRAARRGVGAYQRSADVCVVCTMMVLHTHTHTHKNNNGVLF